MKSLMRFFALFSAAMFVSFSVQAKPKADPSPAQAVKVEEKNAAFEFSYDYPAQAAAIPKLASWLKADQATARKKLAGWAKDGMRDAKANQYEYRAYTLGAHWDVVGDNAQFLSLSALDDNYTGGAHGNYSYRFLLWDRKANKPLKNYSEIFINGKGALDLVRKEYCAALVKERASRLGEDWAKEAGSSLEQCPPYSDLAIGYVGKAGQPFDTVQLTAGPYVAGSYAEGAYEIGVPIPKALLGAIKPQYRSAFAAQ